MGGGGQDRSCFMYVGKLFMGLWIHGTSICVWGGAVEPGLHRLFSYLYDGGDGSYCEVSCAS